MKKKIEDIHKSFWGSKKGKTTLLERINSKREETLFVGASFCGDIREPEEKED